MITVAAYIGARDSTVSSILYKKIKKTNIYFVLITRQNYLITLSRLGCTTLEAEHYDLRFTEDDFKSSGNLGLPPWSSD